ncbi:MAG TPA: hypothetical protein VEK82_06385 [Stellaceae bacterium]|nr:hypothetical protein [Stellaceae bacterium]
MTYRPKRIAAPRLIFDAASALAGQVEANRRIDDDDRDRWYSAITRRPANSWMASVSSATATI